jgi:DNA-binding transcriptional MocR family regulator
MQASKHYRNGLRFSCGHPWDAPIERAVVMLGELANTITSHKSRNFDNP